MLLMWGMSTVWRVSSASQGAVRKGIDILSGNCWDFLPLAVAVDFRGLSWGFGSRIVVQQVYSPDLFYFVVKWGKGQITHIHLTQSNYSYWTVMLTWVLQCRVHYSVLEKFQLECTVGFVIIPNSLLCILP